MSNLQKFCIVFMLFCCIACGSVPQQSNTVTPTSSAAPVASVEALKMSALQLSREYSTNEIAADNKYKGKRVVITGKITSINVILGQNTIVLVGEDDLSRTVTGYFGDDQKEKLATLKKGQSVTIEGECDGKMMGVNIQNAIIK